jgi:hypothetical protein
MSVDVQKFIDFWTENFVQAADANSAGEDTAYVLARRCLAAAETQGFTKADLEKEVGDPEAFIENRLVMLDAREHEQRQQQRG